MGLVFLLLAGAALSLPGCSKQGEGERCSKSANDNADCDDGLICTQDKSATDFGRCCPPEGAQISDSRCNFSSTTSTGGTSSGGGGGTSGGGTSGGGTSGGSTSTGGANAGGDSSTGGTPDSGEGGSGATGDVAGAGGA